MRTAPIGFASCSSWSVFNTWADAHQVPAETEDWEYMWECFLAGYSAAMLDKECET